MRPRPQSQEDLQTTAAQYDLKPHRIGETGIAISIARHCMVRLQAEYRMNEYSLAE
tara:strand:- start:169 stop:336 length:168 start_codon:yes stop_codon:yes gene_type:complete